jgi:thiamine biosynthesis lipoprotein
VYLRDRALGTSGAANQFFVENGRSYGHVLDPRSGWPARGLGSASAIAPTALEADALSTAFYVLGVEGTRDFCRRHPEVGAVLVLPPEKSAAPQVLVIGAAQWRRPSFSSGPRPLAEAEVTV